MCAWNVQQQRLSRAFQRTKANIVLENEHWFECLAMARNKDVAAGGSLLHVYMQAMCVFYGLFCKQVG